MDELRWVPLLSDRDILGMLVELKRLREGRTTAMGTPEELETKALAEGKKPTGPNGGQTVLMLGGIPV